jgi:predicted nucleic acid-binding protein
VSYLLDTNVVSELRRPQPEPRVLKFIAAASLDDLYLSDVTMAEIRFGIERVPDPLKRAEIASWLDHVLRPMFGRRVLPITEDVILRWRLMVEAGRQRGHTYSQPDLFIAATASVHGLTIVTRNTGDFAGTGIALINLGPRPVAQF